MEITKEILNKKFQITKAKYARGRIPVSQRVIPDLSNLPTGEHDKFQNSNSNDPIWINPTDIEIWKLLSGISIFM